MKTYYGIADLARALGWKTTKTHVYYERGKFVEPDAKVGKRPLWTAEQIERIKRGIKHV